MPKNPRSDTKEPRRETKDNWGSLAVQKPLLELLKEKFVEFQFTNHTQFGNYLIRKGLEQLGIIGPSKKRE